MEICNDCNRPKRVTLKVVFNDFQDGVNKVAHELVQTPNEFRTVEFIPNNTHISLGQQGLINGIEDRLWTLEEGQWSVRDASTDESLQHMTKSGCVGIVASTQDFDGIFMVWLNQATSVISVEYLVPDSEGDASDSEGDAF
jgi:hypothetical protein